jgi:DsbC/DsbD-like thiol-disulfide interchange protein
VSIRSVIGVLFGVLSITAPGAVGAIGAASLAGRAAAGESASVSGWVRAPYSAVRLIEAGPNAGSLAAGLELKLDAGWKTYWRYPGDAGLPPRFDFSRSENVAAVEVSWPAPHRFEAGGTVSIGYSGAVVFPLLVRPRDPARPVVLVADVSFAVCGTLCVPAEARLSLPLVGQGAAAPVKAAMAGGGLDAAAGVERARARVPRPAKVGAAGPLAIAEVTIDRTGAPWRVRVEALAPPDAELFVEGPSEAWALPVPAPATIAGEGRVRFAFDLDGAPAGAALDGARLTLTLAAKTGAIETVIALD